MSHRAKVREWLDEARERLKLAIPGTAWYRVNEKAILDYEQLLDRLSKGEREPGEDG